MGFFIAAKSIFRFGELKDHENRMEAEYITIGTMLSFSWGVAYNAWLTKHARCRSFDIPGHTAVSRQRGTIAPAPSILNTPPDFKK